MNKKHLIMGTAGHVDHGKTTLIKALTGYDCDTHKQEKERGITINLGFSHLNLPDGNSYGIVDVPGHSDFIKTMVAGACGIDFVLLIIAADEGIMPQTIEHLEIMKMLDIKYGLVVQTKVDLVDNELLELSKEEIKEFIQGSFLENSPIVSVAFSNEKGIPELIKHITELVSKIPSKENAGFFRMYVDRIFTKKGFGTIVNGSVLSGKVTKNEPVYLLPLEKELRIRRMEHHGKESKTIFAGDRASFNIVGLKQKEIQKGMMLSNKLIKSTKLIDIKLTLFKENVTLGLWNRVLFFLGTNRLMVRIHLLDKDHLQTNQTCLAQVYLPQKIVTQFGDKFIIRNSSGEKTIGGGEIVDPYPLHHRRRRENQIDIVKNIASGKLVDLLTSEVRKSALPITHNTIAEKLNVPANDLIDPIFQELPGDLKFYQVDDDIILLNKKINTSYQNKVLSKLQKYHSLNPLSHTGNTFKELMGIFGDEQNEITSKTLQQILQNLEEKNKLKKLENTWILNSHKVVLNEKIKAYIEQIEKYIISCGNNSIDFSDIQDHAKAISKDKLEQILNYLVNLDKLYYLQQKYIQAEFLEKAKKKVVNYLKKNEDGIRVAHFRDMLETNRNSAIILLEFFDSEGITIRKGNFRYLKKSFKDKL